MRWPVCWASHEPICKLKADDRQPQSVTCAAIRLPGRMPPCAPLWPKRVGDDVYGEDPQINRLECELAERLGKRRAIPADRHESNLTALMAHCGRGEEALVGHPYHVYTYEAQGASVLASIALCPLPAAGWRAGPR